MILTECTFDTGLLSTMTTSASFQPSELLRGPATESSALSNGTLNGMLNGMLNGTLNGSSSPKVGKTPSTDKRGRRLDIELQELFGESRAGKIWGAAAHLSPADVRIPTQSARSLLTDRGDRAFLSMSSRQARLLVNTRAERRSSGLAVSFQDVYTLY